MSINWSKASPAKHAQRILSYGPEGARKMLELSRFYHWPHVDWEMVEAGLMKMKMEAKHD